MKYRGVFSASMLYTHTSLLCYFKTCHKVSYLESVTHFLYRVVFSASRCIRNSGNIVSHYYLYGGLSNVE